VIKEKAIDEVQEIELASHVCKSCGNSFEGFYCNVCGEKILEQKDRSFNAFLKSVVAAVTFADNKFIRTLWLMVARPGFVSKEFAEGRTVNYQKPLQVFFVLNLIYFLFPLVQLFNTSLRTQMYLRTHSALVRTMVRSKVGNDALRLEGYTLMYNQKSTSLAKMLIIVFVILASVPMMIIYRKRNRFFGDHLSLAVELTSFNLALNAIFLSLVLMLTSKVLHMTHTGWEKYLDDSTLTAIFVLTNSYFLFRAGRIFYNQKNWVLILKVAFGLLGLFLSLELYRLTLFLITYWTL
jgi:hypothetical protein